MVDVIVDVNLMLVIVAIVILVTLFVSYPKLDSFMLAPYVIEVDITRKRKPNKEELIDNWINEFSKNNGDIDELHAYVIHQWKENCERRVINAILWQNRKQKLYEQAKNICITKDYPFVSFVFYRTHTRYQQKNYVRQAYYVNDIDTRINLSLDNLQKIVNELSDLDFETSRYRYHLKDQRRLMTTELRNQIKARDNYTCQNCGKVMFDEVGLHIDHIVPISQGGKTISSNLQVLCDKCNLKKGGR